MSCGRVGATDDLFRERSLYAVLGQGAPLFIVGIYRSDFPEVILSKMPVLITSQALAVPHFMAGWAQAAGDPACSTGSPIKSSCPREHRHALLVLHWVEPREWSRVNGWPGVCACCYGENDLLRGKRHPRWTSWSSCIIGSRLLHHTAMIISLWLEKKKNFCVVFYFQAPFNWIFIWSMSSEQ